MTGNLNKQLNQLMADLEQKGLDRAQIQENEKVKELHAKGMELMLGLVEAVFEPEYGV